LAATTVLAAERIPMREILGGYLKDRSPVFYSECSTELGKAMVILETKTGSLWFYELDRDTFYTPPRLSSRKPDLRPPASAEFTPGKEHTK
jgi:hypothetical protein